METNASTSFSTLHLAEANSAWQKAKNSPGVKTAKRMSIRTEGLSLLLDRSTWRLSCGYVYLPDGRLRSFNFEMRFEYEIEWGPMKLNFVSVFS